MAWTRGSRSGLDGCWLRCRSASTKSLGFDEVQIGLPRRRRLLFNEHRSHCGSSCMCLCGMSYESPLVVCGPAHPPQRSPTWCRSKALGLYARRAEVCSAPTRSLRRGAARQHSSGMFLGEQEQTSCRWRCSRCMRNPTFRLGPPADYVLCWIPPSVGAKIGSLIGPQGLYCQPQCRICGLQ